jgi:hypothetical protein
MILLPIPMVCILSLSIRTSTRYNAVDCAATGEPAFLTSDSLLLASHSIVDPAKQLVDARLGTGFIQVTAGRSADTDTTNDFIINNDR